MPEYSQHVITIDYLVVSGKRSVLEYIDALHEHFENPAAIANGFHITPMSPGYSVQMKPASMEKFSFPGGKDGWWQSKEAQPLHEAKRTVGWEPALGFVKKIQLNGNDAAFSNDDGKT